MPASTAAQAPLYAICYDMSDNRERRRVDKLLKGYGFRAQKSVFECHLNKSQKQMLQVALTALNAQSGHVRMYRVYADSQAKTFGGKGTATPDQQFSYSV